MTLDSLSKQKSDRVILTCKQGIPYLFGYKQGDFYTNCCGLFWLKGNFWDHFNTMKTQSKINSSEKPKQQYIVENFDHVSHLCCLVNPSSKPSRKSRQFIWTLSKAIRNFRSPVNSINQTITTLWKAQSSHAVHQLLVFARLTEKHKCTLSWSRSHFFKILMLGFPVVKSLVINGSRLKGGCFLFLFHSCSCWFYSSYSQINAVCQHFYDYLKLGGIAMS